MSLRSKNEIITKVLELRKSSNTIMHDLAKKTAIYRILLVVSILAIPISFYFMFTGLAEITYGVWFLVTILAICFEIFFFRPERRELKTANHRENLAKYLEQALEIIEGPDGVEEFYRRLDLMIIEFNSTDGAEWTYIDSRDPVDARTKIEAFSWIATRGIPTKEEERG